MGYNDTRIAALVSNSFDQSRGLDHFLARTPRQREEIYRLRYEAYLEVGHIEEMEEPSLSDEYDCEKGSHIFGITLNGILVSTIRLGVICRDQKASITYEVFRDHLDPLLERGDKIAHGSRLAVGFCDSTTRRRVILYTLSLTAAFAGRLRADRGAIIVRESHIPFYKRYGFKLVSGPRRYHESQTPLNLMMMDLQASSQNPIILTPQLALIEPSLSSGH